MTPSSIRVGVIGAGRWGQNIIRTLSELGALAAVAEKNADALDAVKAQYPGVKCYEGFQCLLDDPAIDAVVVATPAATHAAFALAVMDAGKHLFVEKPLAMTSDEVQVLSREVKRFDHVFMVGHLLLYQPAITFMKHFIDAGRLGRLISCHQVRRNLGTVREHENALYSLGVHDVAVLQYLIDDTPVSCRATGHCVVQKTIEDDVYSHIEYESGVKAHIHVSWMWPIKQRELMVIGELGALHFDELTQTVTHHQNTVIPEKREQGSEVVYQGGGQALTLEMAHFIDCIHTGRKPKSDDQQGLVVCDILNALQGQLVHERADLPEPSHSDY